MKTSFCLYYWDVASWLSLCNGITSYLAFSVPRSPILGVLALALAFLLSSVCKFTQQRLRRSCTEKERGKKKDDWIPPSCDPSGRLKSFSTTLHFFSFTITSLSLLHLLLHSAPPMERLDKIPDTTNNWQKSQNPNAGSPFLLWPWLAAYERALQGIVEIIITVIALVNTSERVMQHCSGSQSLFLEGIPVSEALSPSVLLLKTSFSLICNCMPFSTSISTRGARKLSNILRLLFLEQISTFILSTDSKINEKKNLFY